MIKCLDTLSLNKSLRFYLIYQPAINKLNELLSSLPPIHPMRIMSIHSTKCPRHNMMWLFITKCSRTRLMSVNDSLNPFIVLSITHLSIGNSCDYTTSIRDLCLVVAPFSTYSCLNLSRMNVLHNNSYHNTYSTLLKPNLIF